MKLYVYIFLPILTEYRKKNEMLLLLIQINYFALNSTLQVKYVILYYFCYT